MSEPTEKQVQRARERLRLAQSILKYTLDGLSQRDISRMLDVNLNIVSFWVRSLGIAPTRRGGIGANKAYDRMPADPPA